MTASNRTTLAAMALGAGLAIAGFAMARTDDFLRARLMAFSPPVAAAPETVKAEMVKTLGNGIPLQSHCPPAPRNRLCEEATCPARQEIHARRAPHR